MLKNNADKIIMILTGILVALGIVILSSASSNLAKNRFDDSYFYVKRQVIFGIGAGIIGFIAARFTSIKLFKKASFALLLLNIVALALIFTPLGGDFGTASRWLVIGGLAFQPSEFLKITFIVYLAAWLAGNKERKNNIAEGFIPFLIICGIIGGLLIAQPSTSTLVIILIAALAMFVAVGTRFSFIFGLIGIGILAIGFVIFNSPYRLQRIQSYINPAIDSQESRYHVNQSLITIGAGGITGVGYGQSTLKLGRLPEPMGDSIFAIASEEFGFIGAMFFIALFFILSIVGILGSRKVRSEFGRAALIGLSCVIGVQAFIHMGSVSGLIPMTGVPLPFISYGSSSLAVFMTISGLMVNILKNA